MPSDSPGQARTIALLRSDHDTSGFDSGEPALDDWLRKRAIHNLQAGASRTYVACPPDEPVVEAYYALSMGQILAAEALGSMRRNMPRYIPSVILGRLAVDRRRQGTGLGRAMLADAVRRTLRASAEVSARLIVVHAISDEAEAFYLRHGFVRLPVDTPTLALDLNKLRR